MLEAKKQNLLQTLEQVRVRINQLQQELQQRAAQEQQIMGALMLCNELISEAVDGAKQGEAETAA